MTLHGSLKSVSIRAAQCSRKWCRASCQPRNRSIHNDRRHRASRLWAPVQTSDKKPTASHDVDSNKLLVQAGFLRQQYSGIFHLLPLGLRVQEKLEKLIDKYMSILGASKLSLSSISSQGLWSRSGRLSTNPELFKFKDRKEAQWLLSPTHEEEITALVASMATSYRDLPIRLYQVSRKYRDEPRPRQGLLRGKEFLMKDLYTFDVDIESALKTYEAVRKAYTAFLNELKVPYIVAAADSGDMGGSLSHEYHLPSPKGEDDIVKCSNCDHVRNEELVEKIHELEIVQIPIETLNLFTRESPGQGPQLTKFFATSKDGATLIKAYAPAAERASDGRHLPEINPHIVKAAIPDVVLGVEDPLRRWRSGRAAHNSGPSPETQQSLFSIKYLLDSRLSLTDLEHYVAADYAQHGESVKYYHCFFVAESSGADDTTQRLSKIAPGDPCPSCPDGRLTVQRAIEVGHTFHLGTRYSSKLGAAITTKDNQRVDMEMGCHGIGVSRMIAAIASVLADEKGLNWPRAIAPFQVVIIPRSGDLHPVAEQLYDKITSADGNIDAIIDDRENRSLIQGLVNAELIGFPVTIVIGRSWEDGKLEIKCRHPGTKLDLSVDDAMKFVPQYLGTL